ncbi:MAG TPA: methylenetetrahydrofolate reductase [Gammaproteobacteria bacterium]|nr:methylenetetrahydrofolate reductase [Gammaproteobacteria bacterium]
MTKQSTQTVEAAAPEVAGEPGTDALEHAIASLMEGFTIEATPQEVKRGNGFADCLRPGTRVFVPWLQDWDYDRTVVACRTLRDAGMTPVPHLAVRGLKSADQLEAVLKRFRDEAGADELLLLAGGLAEPAGPFDRTMQVLETGLIPEHGIRRIGVAGHPEGSPDIPDTELTRALQEKYAFAEATGLALHIVTQFFFDAAPTVHWERSIRDQGNRLPVSAGLHGLASVTTLIRYAKACGVGKSLGAFMRNQGSVMKIASAKAPDGLVVELARSRLRDPGSLLQGCHFFPFGSVERTARWAGALAAGKFELDERSGALKIEC